MYKSLRNFINCNTNVASKKRMSPNCEFVDFVFQTVVVNAEILQKNKKMNPYFCKDSIAVLHKSGFDKKNPVAAKSANACF